jgi:sarcosine oxidase subunit beta
MWLSHCNLQRAPHFARHLSVSSQSADVIVIGAGVIGWSIGLELSRRGVSTINVDAYSGAGMGSTGYSSGIVRTYYSTVDSCKLAIEGYQYWKVFI